VKIHYTQHPGLQVVETIRHEDDRGWFSEQYRVDHDAQFFREGVKQISKSHSRVDVLRGFHIQPGMAKLMRVIRGSIYTVAIDVNPKSSQYLFQHSILLSAINDYGVFATDNFARAFLALEDNTVVEYYHSDVYNPGRSYTIAWNGLGELWPIRNPILSEKDQKGMSLLDFCKIPHTWD
jgi:dTDP-4-dehydrorhamnose 3,5-epimerase